MLTAHAIALPTRRLLSAALCVTLFHSIVTASAKACTFVPPLRPKFARRLMAWRSHGSSQSSLVGALSSNGIIKTERIAEALRAVDRAEFVPVANRDLAYEDAPVPIGYQATISAPHMHAYMLEALKDHLKPGARVLDVGSGSGYLSAVMALLVSPGGKVYGVEHIAELVETSRSSVSASPAAAPLLESGVLELIAAEGRAGLPSRALFDAIHVGAAAPELPKALVDQLAPGGRMVVPVDAESFLGRTTQSLEIVDKDKDGNVRQRSAMG